MKELSTTQKKKLRGMAHHLEPVVMVGQKGVGAKLIVATDNALLDHELIKIKFLEFKDEKKELIIDIAQKTNSVVVGMVGNVAMLYREHPEEKKRKIKI